MTLFDDGDTFADHSSSESHDREISLSPAIILGVFFALALVCAVFFGFGYSVGRRSTVESTPSTVPSPVVSNESRSASRTGSIDSPNRTSEPPANSGEIPQPDAEPTRSRKGSDLHKPTAVLRSSDNTSLVSSPSIFVKPPFTAREGIVGLPLPAVQPVTASGSIVQIAAFSHTQDAELVAGALRRRGYDATIRQEAQDHLLHVQMGPFPSKKEAELMRQRLQADGYNAIVK